MYCSVYVIASSAEEARKISQVLIEEKLAACSNFWSIESVYRWDNEIINDKEYAIILKTKSELFTKLCKRIVEIHSYEIPCIVKYNISSGFETYLNWISSETQQL